MLAPSSNQVFFQTDTAWDFLREEQRPPAIDVREEARGLRFITSARRIEKFALLHAAEFRPFTLYGSGDFHHLSAVWTRQFTEPFILLSFDNHPDWDIRPPHWSCGAWINRALENPRVHAAAIWGCGNFECEFPGRLLGNRAAARERRLLVHPWARDPRATYPDWLSPITPETWRSQFTGWLEKIRDWNIYVTIDLDCLAPGEVYTNWEQGRFTCADLVWALGQVREKAKIIGGDLCGAWSPQKYRTAFQKLAGWWDHPKVAAPDPATLAVRQLDAFTQLWPILHG